MLFYFINIINILKMESLHFKKSLNQEHSDQDEPQGCKNNV